MSNCKFGMTQTEIAKVLGITRSAVCQIEKQAIEKLKKSYKAHILRQFLYDNY